MPDSPRGVGAGAIAQPRTKAGATHSINLLIDDRSVSRRSAVSHPLGTRLPNPVPRELQTSEGDIS